MKSRKEDAIMGSLPEKCIDLVGFVAQQQMYLRNPRIIKGLQKQSICFNK